MKTIAIITFICMPSVATAQGVLKNVADIPASCNDSSRLYVQRHWTGKTKQISSQKHDIWKLYAESNDSNAKKPFYVLQHHTFGTYDKPWKVAQYKRVNVKWTWSDEGFNYYNYPTAKNGAGWLLGEKDESSTDSNGHTTTTTEPFGFCPSKAAKSKGNQMTLWRCNKGGTYPNFYTVTSADKKDYVFFDVDGGTYRLYADPKDNFVRYEECLLKKN